MLKKCCECKKEDRLKNLKKIKHKLYCSQCYTQLRKKHREETIKKEGIEKELKELEKKAKRENTENNREYYREYQRRRYREKNPKPRTYKQKSDEPPKIRGYKKKEKTNCYITLQEKRVLFGHLIKEGFDYDEAGERISNLVNQLKDIRDELKLRNKSEEEIKTKQQRMIEQLYLL